MVGHEKIPTEFTQQQCKCLVLTSTYSIVEEVFAGVEAVNSIPN
jgi:hypothetical protein